MARAPADQRVQQQAVEEGPSGFEIVWTLLKMFAFMYMQQQGLTPRSAAAKRDLIAFRRRLEARGDIAEQEKKEIDSVIDTIAKWLGFPDIQHVPEENRKVVYDIAYYVNLFFPEIVDYIYAPTGSKSQLYDYIGTAFQKYDPALSRKGPSGRPLFRDVADYIANKIYANADLKNNDFIARTGGMPAGAYGEMIYYMLRLGIIGYNNNYDKIIADIERHGPGVVKTALLLEDLGKTADISDAVTAYSSLLPSLAKDTIGGPPAEQIERLRLVLPRLQNIFAPRGPGELSTDEALKKDAERIVKAINSMGGRWYGAILYAFDQGKLRPNSQAYAAAQQILMGRPIPIFNSNQAYTLLVQGGLSPQDAMILLQSPNLYKPYFNDQRVQHALRGAQLMEFGRNVNLLAAGLIRGGVSVDIAQNAAMANFANLIGYTYPEAQQIIMRYDPNLFVEVDRLVRENMERPQAPILGRHKTALRLVSAIKDVAQNPPENWRDALIRVIGATMDYYPEEDIKQPAELEQPRQPILPEQQAQFQPPLQKPQVAQTTAPNIDTKFVDEQLSKYVALGDIGKRLGISPTIEALPTG